MTKLEAIFSMDKIEAMKILCQNLNLGLIMFSEVKVYNPDLVETRKYRGATYSLELITKIKAEMYLEDEKADSVKAKIIEEIIDTEKGDICVTF